MPRAAGASRWKSFNTDKLQLLNLSLPIGAAAYFVVNPVLPYALALLQQ